MPVAHGTEEMEAITTVDILRRGGMNVTIAGESEVVICSRGIRINPDRLIDDIDESEEFDAIVLPGGAQGVENLSSNDDVRRIVTSHHRRGAVIAAICAAPLLLKEFGLLEKDAAVTSHPNAAAQLAGYAYSTDTVVRYKNLITSRGAGTAIPFSLAILERLGGEAVATEVAKQIVWEQ
ncbi:MAG: DJ-1/PfpI family protein [Candidatus Kapabacteria bacterium]|nr:DJ-1/PfpI family protein [Candidatus Kapabacteria bacterium]